MLPLKEYFIIYTVAKGKVIVTDVNKYHKSLFGIYVTHILIVKISYGCFSLIVSIPPLGLRHINFLGDYTFDFMKRTALDSLRPLKTKGEYNF